MDEIGNPFPMIDFPSAIENPNQFNIFPKMQYFMPEMIQPINEAWAES